MKIALNGFFWDKPFTGSGMYLRQIWRHMPEAPGDHQFVLLRPEGGGEAITQRLNAMVIDAPVGPLNPGSERVRQVWWEQFGLPAAAGSVKPDVLHCPYLAAPLFGGGGRLVVTVHDLIPWVLPDYRGSPPMRLYLALAGRAARRAAILLADSECSRNDIMRYFGTPPGRVKAIHLGAEPELFSPVHEADLAEMRWRFGLPERYAFYIGGFDRRKNVPLLLRTWSAALAGLRERGEPEPVLAVAGNIPAPGGVNPDVQGEARRLGLLDGPGFGSLRLLGRVSEADKHRLLAGAHLFLFPSLYEGFGYDPLEAMAAGAPVLCSNSSSLPEIVGDAGELLPPDDEEAWTRAIERLWFDDARRARLSAEGRERAATFRPEETAWHTLKAYAAVTRAPKRYVPAE